MSGQIKAAREDRLHREAFNAHENAEQAAIAGIYEHLRSCSDDALVCLADPQWRWETRSSLSGWIIDAASEVLDERLEAKVV